VPSDGRPLRGRPDCGAAAAFVRSPVLAVVAVDFVGVALARAVPALLACDPLAPLECDPPPLVWPPPLLEWPPPPPLE